MNRKVFEDDKNNQIRISSFNDFEGETTFNQIAAKFVVKGSETYVINGKKFRVKQGEYIIGNNQIKSEVEINENTIGLCIDISNEIINEIIDNTFENKDLKEFIITDKFLVNKYHADHTQLGYRLNQLSNNIFDQPKNELLTTEFFYSVGESIVNDQSIIFSQYAKLNYKKIEVNKEVFRNLLHAKNYIDSHFLENIQLHNLLEIAFISKYAFIRLFKTTFGFTPYHYILQKRLIHALSLLEKGHQVAETAIMCGFADSPSFSKIFKSYFCKNPGTIKK